MYAYLDIEVKPHWTLGYSEAENGCAPSSFRLCTASLLSPQGAEKPEPADIGFLLGYDFSGLGTYGGQLTVYEYADLYPIVPPEKTYYVTDDKLVFQVSLMDGSLEKYIWVNTDGEWQFGDTRPDDSDVKKASELTESLKPYSGDFMLSDFVYNIGHSYVYFRNNLGYSYIYSAAPTVQGNFKEPLPFHVVISVLDSIPEGVDTKTVLSEGQKVVTADCLLTGGYKLYSSKLEDEDSPYWPLYDVTGKDKAWLTENLCSIYNDSYFFTDCEDSKYKKNMLLVCQPCSDAVEKRIPERKESSQPDLRPQYFISKVVSNDESTISQKELLAEIAKIRATYPKLRYNLEDAKAYPKEWSHTDVPVSEDKE